MHLHRHSGRQYTEAEAFEQEIRQLYEKREQAEVQIVHVLEDDYLSRNPSPSKRAAYIQGTLTRARDWGLQ